VLNFLLDPQDFSGTSPAAWLAAGGAAAASSPLVADALLAAPQPRTYRELYPELLRATQLIGMWIAGGGAGPRGCLYRFAFEEDCVRVDQLAPAKCFHRSPPVKELFRLGPGHPQHTFSIIEGAAGGAASSSSSRSCLVREQRRAPRRGSSAAAEAAAAVAAGGGHSAASLGSSPPSSFNFELLQFMAGNVASAGRSRSARRQSGGGSGGSSGGSGSAPPPLLHHFTRLPVPVPTRQHPLAGLWSALYGPHGLEVLRIEYDFTGSAAVIKVRPESPGGAGRPAPCERLGVCSGRGQGDSPARCATQLVSRQLPAEPRQRYALVVSADAPATMLTR
jgi:hypothetical protein